MLIETVEMESLFLCLLLTSVIVGIVVRRRLGRKLAGFLTVLAIAGIVLATGLFLLVMSVGIPGIHPLQAILIIALFFVSSVFLLPIGMLGLVGISTADGDPTDEIDLNLRQKKR
jgi:ABC-type Fe3+ transport system permease subunit